MGAGVYAVSAVLCVHGNLHQWFEFFEGLRLGLVKCKALSCRHTFLLIPRRLITYVSGSAVRACLFQLVDV